MRGGGAAAVVEATTFFMRDDPVHEALFALAERLDEEGISYALERHPGALSAQAASRGDSRLASITS